MKTRTHTGHRHHTYPKRKRMRLGTLAIPLPATPVPGRLVGRSRHSRLSDSWHLHVRALIALGHPLSSHAPTSSLLALARSRSPVCAPSRPVPVPRGTPHPPRAQGQQARLATREQHAHCSAYYRSDRRPGSHEKKSLVPQTARGTPPGLPGGARHRGACS